MGDYDYEFDDPYAPKDSLQYGTTAGQQADDEYERFLQQQQQQQQPAAPQVDVRSHTEYYEEVVEEHVTEEEVTVESESVEEVTVDSEEIIEEEVIEEIEEGQAEQRGRSPPPPPPAATPEPKLGTVQQHLRDGTWDSLLEYLQHLKTQEPHTVLQALSEVDKNDSNPYHTASWKAPYHVTKQLVNALPSEFREELLMKQDSQGNTPLHLACSKLRVSEADGMLDAGALRVFTKYAPRSQEVLNWSGDCPIHLLLTSPAFCDIDGNGEAPHAEMCEDVVTSILEKYPNLALTVNFAGSTILHVAAESGVHERILLCLLDRLPATAAQIADKAGRLPLHSLAASTNGARIVPITFATKLVEVFPPSIMMPCNSGDTPLHLMVSNTSRNSDLNYRTHPNTTKFAKLLLGSRTEPSECPLLVRNREKFFTPLHCSALFSAPSEAIFVLLNSPFAKQAFGMLDAEKATPFHLACASDSVADSTEVVEMLGTKDGGVLQDSMGRTPLHVAAENPRSTKAVIKVLADINPKAAKVETEKNLMPLHSAIRSQADESVVKSLFKMYPKAAKSIFDGNNTVLHEACQYKLSASSVRAMLKEFPELAQEQNKYGNLPLHVATAYQAPAEIVEMLLSVHPEGAMTKNRNGDVPLHYAASFPQSSESTIMLVDTAPESACVANENGDTPYDRAKESKLDTDVLKLIKKAAKQFGGGNDSAGSLDALNRSKHRKSRKSSNDDSLEFDSERSRGKTYRKYRKEDESAASLTLGDLKYSNHSTPPAGRYKKPKNKKGKSNDMDEESSDSSEADDKKKSGKKGKAALKAAALAVMSAQKASKWKSQDIEEESLNSSEGELKKKSGKKGKAALKAAALAVMSAQKTSKWKSQDIEEESSDSSEAENKKKSGKKGKAALKAAALAVMSAQKTSKWKSQDSDEESSDSSDGDVKKKSDKKAKATLKAAALAVISAQKASEKAQKQLAASMSILQLEQEKAASKSKKSLSITDVADDVTEKNGKRSKASKKRESKRFAESSSTLDSETSSRSKKNWKKLQSAVLKDAAKAPKDVTSEQGSKKNWAKLREAVAKDASSMKSPTRNRSASSGRKGRSSLTMDSKSSDLVSPGGKSRKSRSSRSPAPVAMARASIAGLPLTAPPLTPSSKKQGTGSDMLDDMLSEPTTPLSTRRYLL